MRAASIAVGLLMASTAPASAQDVLRLEVAGGRTQTFTESQLAALSPDTVRIEMHHSAPATYAVVSLSRLLAGAGLPVDSLRGRQLAMVVVAEARDGYRVAFSLGELAPALGAREVLVAFRRDGVAIPSADGPFRLIVRGDERQARSIRQLQVLRVVDAAGMRSAP